MNRELWKETATENWVPKWTCPSCATGYFELFQRPIAVHPTRETRRDMGREDFNQGDAEERFACVLFCNNPHCKEAVAVSGVTGFEQAYDGEGSWTWDRYLVPIFFLPAPRMIEIPKDCPRDVRAELVSAFKLYWCHGAAAVGRLRVAVELLLTHMGLKRFEVRSVGRPGRRRLSLHERIELLREKNNQLGNVVLAVKWLGNEGSHPGSVTKNDLLDGFEMMEHVLDEVYVRAKSPIRKIVRQINRTRAPRSRRRS